jgi:hypothetical protein
MRCSPFSVWESISKRERLGHPTSNTISLNLIDLLSTSNLNPSLKLLSVRGYLLSSNIFLFPPATSLKLGSWLRDDIKDTSSCQTESRKQQMNLKCPRYMCTKIVACNHFLLSITTVCILCFILSGDVSPYHL